MTAAQQFAGVVGVPSWALVAFAWGCAARELYASETWRTMRTRVAIRARILDSRGGA